ncbi:MAG: FxSxx-COOH system tetratricopeptide repeat protein [Chthoniobacterales bacterium]
MADGEPPAKKDFFISYNKADKAWAEWIAQQLEQIGEYSVVIQAWDFRPGGNFVLDMQRALVSCNRMIAVLSPDYLTSVFTAPEWASAFGDDSTGLRRKLVPVRVRECKPDGLLANIVYLDLLSLNAGDAGRALLIGVDIKPVDRTTPRPFPGSTETVGVRMERPPGMLPDIWNVPFLRNPNFTEPGQRLRDLHEAFRSGGPAAFTQALAGLGGVGKTQLAVEYAYRYAGDYNLVWWLRSEQPATLAADYAALAAQLGLPEKDETRQPVIIAAVRDALRRRHDWLLIFDNANTPEEIRDLLPGAGGHVLVTSRHAAWGGVAQKMEVKKWLPEVAVEFLLKRTGQADAAAAGELARDLDYLALALEQAAAYVESAGKTLAGYLAIFRKHQVEVFKHSEPGTDYAATVATTWEISFQRLEKESPAGVALLYLCAFFAPDDIPRDVIIAGAARLPEPLRTAVGNALAFDDAVGAIRSYSLIETSGEVILSLHRLVQAVIRDRLGEAGRKQWAEAAVKLVNDAFPGGSDDVRTWKECDRLLAHGIATTDLAESLGVALEAVARLVNEMGMYARARAEHEKAKAAYERALEIYEPLLGPEHENTATAVNNLGSALADLGDLPGAKAAFERALQIHEKIFGSNHISVATDVNNLGSVLRKLGDLPGAKAAMERAVKIDETSSGLEHPSVARDVNNLGGVLQDLGDLLGAKAAFERALAIDTKNFGPEHPSVAIRLNNLALVLADLGEIPEAKAAFERSLAIFEEFLGDNHPKTLHVRENLKSLPS